MVALIVLAAGASTRLGQPKQLLRFRGWSLLQHTMETAFASACRPVVVVLGAGSERLQQEAAPYPAHVVVNKQWQTGMSSSLRHGLEALEAADPTIDAAVITLCDQPLLSPDIINGLVETFHRTASPIAASQYSETVGVPALFSRSLWNELKTLKGHEGARKLILRDPSRVCSVPFPGGEMDIDTLDDYQQLQEIDARFHPEVEINSDYDYD